MAQRFVGGGGAYPASGIVSVGCSVSVELDVQCGMAGFAGDEGPAGEASVPVAVRRIRSVPDGQLRGVAQGEEMAQVVGLGEHANGGT